MGGGGPDGGVLFPFHIHGGSGACVADGTADLAFDFNMAPSSGVSFDLFAGPPLCAVAACGGLGADVDPVPGVGAAAATGVAGVSAPAAPGVDAVPAAGVGAVAAAEGKAIESVALS